MRFCCIKVPPINLLNYEEVRYLMMYYLTLVDAGE